MARPNAQISPFVLAQGEATAGGGGGGAAAGTGAFPFKGALVTKSADQNNIATGTEVVIVWATTIYDIGSWFDAALNRLVVPAGVTRVRISCELALGVGDAQDIQVSIKKNGLNFPGMQWWGNSGNAIDGTYTQAFGLNSCVVEVVEGDFFDIIARTTVANKDFPTEASRTWFSIEAVETTESGKTATVQTTDATQTVLASGAMAADSAHTIRAYGHGREDATGDTYHFQILGGARNEGGTSSAPTPNVIEVTDAGAATWDATLVANDVADQWEIKVTGEAAHTIDWTVTFFEIITQP